MSIREVNETYRHSLATFGDDPRALGWKSESEQHARFAALCDGLPRDVPLEVGDFGCGFADLLPYLESQDFVVSRYVGIDVNSEMLDHAKEKVRPPGASSLQIVELKEDLEEVSPVDWWFVSGTWNVRGSTSATEWRERVEEELQRLFLSARSGVACNFLSDHVDFEDAALFYAPVSQLIDFVRSRLSRRFTIRHDYMPFEWTLTVLHEAS
jgi:SAM-dependent methyltransferase